MNGTPRRNFYTGVLVHSDYWKDRNIWSDLLPEKVKF
jgi:hypothetical protein